MSIITWDNLALLCALAAVAARLWDRHQIGGMLSGLTLIFAALGKRAAHRRERAALPSPAMWPTERPAVAGDRP
jgi:hypothetical protein